MSGETHPEQRESTQFGSTVDPALAATLGTTPTRSDEQSFVRGRKIGRYVIDEHLGAGAMGVVYSAHDPDLDRKVALKFLKSGQGDPKARARLFREAQSMAKLAHPNVVTVHDVGTHGDEVFVAMEFVQGGTLRQWLDERPRGWREVVKVFGAVASGLAAAHGAGLVHRDLKPENIMIGTDERVRVMDFGLARAWESGPGEQVNAESVSSERPQSLNLTRTGALLGTPAYMAPEQWEGAQTDARSDQFSFCVALWESLYGERPFRGQTRAALVLAIVEGKVMPPSDPRRAPIWLRRVAERGLSVNPAARWPSMLALLSMLTLPRHRWLWPVVGASASAATIGLIAVLNSGAPSAEELDNEWCTRIVNPMYKRFADRYPFEPNADDAVRLADFEAFFHPESGAIRKTRDELLGDWVATRGNDIEARKLSHPDSNHLDPAVIDFLNRAQEIGMDMFVDDELRIDFDISLGCNGHVGRVELKIGGEINAVDCNYKMDGTLPSQTPDIPMHMPGVRMRWPNTDGRGASLTAWGRQGRKTVEESSEWGIFKMLEHGSREQQTGTWGTEFRFDFTAFNLGILVVWLKPVRARSGAAFFEPSGKHAYPSLLRAANVLPPKRLFVTGGCSSSAS
ncbi:MAG: protein kinase [Nannocystis sp.]|nr:protein kinase [Nannocystis sp.]MBA3550177.1 protein kinase [Nannocystis sp.]